MEVRVGPVKWGTDKARSVKRSESEKSGKRSESANQIRRRMGGSEYFIGFPRPLSLVLQTQGQTQASLLEATFCD